MRCVEHGLLMYRRYSTASREPVGDPICGACEQRKRQVVHNVERPDPTIVTRDESALVPVVCLLIAGALILLAMMLYG